jgi:hypothetical protein
MDIKNESQVLTRYIAAPTKLDYMPFGSLCVVIKNDECTEREYFIQTAQNETDPVWLSAQDLLFSVYKERLQDPVFLQNLLTDFKP